MDQQPSPSTLALDEACARARVVLLTRAGCHLCSDAEAVVAQVCAELAHTHEFVDVDVDPRLRALFGDHVPVTFVDGEQLGMWFLEAAQLQAALRRPAGAPGGATHSQMADAPGRTSMSDQEGRA